MFVRLEDKISYIDYGYHNPNYRFAAACVNGLFFLFYLCCSSNTYVYG